MTSTAKTFLISLAIAAAALIFGSGYALANDRGAAAAPHFAKGRADHSGATLTAQKRDNGRRDKRWEDDRGRRGNHKADRGRHNGRDDRKPGRHSRYDRDDHKPGKHSRYDRDDHKPGKSRKDNTYRSSYSDKNYKTPPEYVYKSSYSDKNPKARPKGAHSGKAHKPSRGDDKREDRSGGRGDRR
jgi:hypothetical protein